MEMEKMIELIDAVSKSDLTGFKYEEEGIKLHLSKKENTCYVTENLSAPVNAVTTSAAEIKKAAEGDQISGTSAEETPVGNVYEGKKNRSNFIGKCYGSVYGTGDECQCSRCKESMFCCKSKFRYLCGMAYN